MHERMLPPLVDGFWQAASRVYRGRYPASSNYDLMAGNDVKLAPGHRKELS